MIAMEIRALFEMLRGAPAPALDRNTWEQLITFADRTQLTLHIRGVPGLPAHVHEQIAGRRTRNLKRRERMLSSYEEIAHTLERAGIEFIVLKGFTHEIGSDIDSASRVQYDLDILCPQEQVAGAQGRLLTLGYRPHTQHALSDEHLPPLVRPFDWTWRGDYFDPDMPIPVELHSSLWDRKRDRIVFDSSGFWDRRTVLNIAGLSVPALSEIDRIGFAALHVLRHVLRNDVRPAHAFELARFLQARQNNSAFWNEWRSLHQHGLRTLEATGFQLAHAWFCGSASHCFQTELQPVETWFRSFAWSPIANLSKPNKDAVWLHLTLLGNWRDRAFVLANRLMPVRFPHRGLADRLRYHAEALAPALASGRRFFRGAANASTASQISDWKRRRV